MKEAGKKLKKILGILGIASVLFFVEIGRAHV